MVCPSVRSEPEALWVRRLSDIRTVSSLVLRGMFREATDLTQNPLQSGFRGAQRH